MNTEQVAAARARALRLVSAATSDLRNVVLNYNGDGGVAKLEDVEVGDDVVNDHAVRAMVARSKRAVRFALADDEDDEDEEGDDAYRPSSKNKSGRNDAEQSVDGNAPTVPPVSADEITQAAFLKLLERVGWACTSIQAQGQDRAAATKLIAAALEFMLSGGSLAHDEKNLLLL